MSDKTIGRFGFEVTKMHGDEPVPFHPWVVIKLKWWTCESDASPILSPNLCTEAEIDDYVSKLKKDLGAVARKAKRKLGDAQKAAMKGS